MRRLRSLRRGELISAGCALGLLVVLFGFAWYGVAGVPDPTRAQPAIASTENGWHGLTIVRWVLMLTVLVALGSLGWAVGRRGRGRRAETGGMVLLLGLVSALLLVWRVLIQPPSPSSVTDQKLGALLGLGCAVGIALGGHESLSDLRARRRNARPAPHRRSADRSSPAPSVTRPRPSPDPELGT